MEILLILFSLVSAFVKAVHVLKLIILLSKSYRPRLTSSKASQIRIPNQRVKSIRRHDFSRSKVKSWVCTAHRYPTLTLLTAWICERSDGKVYKSVCNSVNYGIFLTSDFPIFSKSPGHKVSSPNIPHRQFQRRHRFSLHITLPRIEEHSQIELEFSQFVTASSRDCKTRIGKQIPDISQSRCLHDHWSRQSEP